MLPSKDSDTFSIYVDLKDGSSINQTKEVTQCIVKNLQKELCLMEKESKPKKQRKLP